MSEGTTALARRNPEALRRSPSFYPEGHAGPDLAAVVFAAPLVGSVSTAVVLATLGVGFAAAVTAGVLMVPVSCLVANHVLSSRGKSALASARETYAQDTARGMVALEAVAQSGALPEVRLEAAGLLALHRIQQGQIREAVDILSIREQDASKPRRRRNWVVGLRGEVTRSILAWLSPSSFSESGVAPSSAFDDKGIDDDGCALVSLLRVLEHAAQSDDAALEQSWRECERSQLQLLFPTLHAIGLAIVGERIPLLLEALHSLLDGDRGDHYRVVLQQLFPRMQLLGASGYREAILDEPVAIEQALVVSAPEQLVALAKQDMAEPGSGAPAAFLMTYAGFLAAFAGGGLAMGSLAGGLLAGAALSMYCGTPVAAVWGSRRTQSARRSHRVAPLLDLQPQPPTAWLTECASGPPGPVTRTSGYRKLQPLPTQTMALYLAVALAEDALQRVELGDAWEHIAWWYDGFSGRLQHQESVYAAGSALVRVAALSGHLAEARRLMSVLPEQGNEWDSTENRTQWGNAPFATRLADALLLALQGEWDLAKARMEWAREAPVVAMSEQDRALYDLIVSRASEAGVTIAWPYRSRDPSAKAWASTVWPKERGSTTAAS